MTMTMPQPTLRIAQEQIDFYHREGYLAIDVITTPEEVALLRVVYDRIFAQRAGRETGHEFDLAGTDEEGVAPKLPQILGPSNFVPEMKYSLYRANAEAICGQLLGEGCQPGGDHAILKPPHSPATTPWHQDEAYWGPEMDYTYISVWMPLQDVDMHNGCMCFIPGSHQWEVLPHHCINYDPRIHGLEVDELDTSTMVSCPLPAGGATFHANRTLHFTPANDSDEPRRAYIVGYRLPPTKRATPRDFYWNRMKKTARQERLDKSQSQQGQTTSPAS